MTTAKQKADSLASRSGGGTELSFRSTSLDIQTRAENGDPLPAGICGRLTGIALIYNQVDDYGTLFAPGCLARTIAEKVANRKVKLFADHEQYTGEHVGTVASMQDVGGACVMAGDLFDTDAGRSMLAYLKAVVASKSDTGLSIGFRSVRSQWVDLPAQSSMPGLDKVVARQFDEIELKHVGITPVPAVEGADVTGVRRESNASDAQDVPLLKRTLVSILRALPEHEARAVIDEHYATSAAVEDTDAASRVPPETSAPNAETPAESEAADGSAVATEADRLAAFRNSFAVARTS